MKIYKNIEPRSDTPAIALGFFDGFHIGHKYLFEVLDSYAKGRKKVVFTFENHPDRVLGLDTKYILTNTERLDFFDKRNIDEVYFIDFNHKFMKMDKDSFIKDILIEKLNVGLVVVGYDFTFGYKALGTAQYLCEQLRAFNRECIVIDPVKLNNQIVSSTLIRSLISKGDIKLANMMLGYRFFMSGVVKKGNQIGQKIGFPTLNIEYSKEKVVPKKGVYVTFTIIDSQRYLSITNVGVNPTISTSSELKIETHVIDYKKEVYGKEIRIEFVDFVREEKKFSSLSELKNQITKDIEFVKGLYCHIK